MPDLTTIAAVVAAAKHASDLVAKTNDAALKMAVADVVATSADLKLEMAELKANMSELRDENRQLKESLKRALSKKHEVTFKDGMYYTDDDDGPFCTRCQDSESKLIRLSEVDSHRRRLIGGKYKCPECDSVFAGRRS